MTAHSNKTDPPLRDQPTRETLASVQHLAGLLHGEQSLRHRPPSVVAGPVEPAGEDLDAIPCWPVLAWGFAAILGRSRIGIGDFMDGTLRAVPSKARRDWGGFIRGNDGLIGDVDEPAATGSMQFICVVPGLRDHAGARSGGLGGAPAVRFMTGSINSLDIAGVELSGRGDSVVGGGDHVVGEVDQSSPG